MSIIDYTINTKPTSVDLSINNSINNSFHRQLDEANLVFNQTNLPINCTVNSTDKTKISEDIKRMSVQEMDLFIEILEKNYLNDQIFIDSCNSEMNTLYINEYQSSGKYYI